MKKILLLFVGTFIATTASAGFLSGSYGWLMGEGKNFLSDLDKDYIGDFNYLNRYNNDGKIVLNFDTSDLGNENTLNISVEKKDDKYLCWISVASQSYHSSYKGGSTLSTVSEILMIDGQLEKNKTTTTKNVKASFCDSYGNKIISTNYLGFTPIYADTYNRFILSIPIYFSEEEASQLRELSKLGKVSLNQLKLEYFSSATLQMKDFTYITSFNLCKQLYWMIHFAGMSKNLYPAVVKYLKDQSK